MRINGLRCDACCKEHLFNNPMLVCESTQSTLPATWYMVVRGGEDESRGQEPRLFCSSSCLAEWAAKESHMQLTIAELGKVTDLARGNLDYTREEAGKESPRILVGTLPQVISPVWHDLLVDSIKRKPEATAPIDAAERQAHERRLAEDPDYARQYAQWEQEWRKENEEREDEGSW